MTYKHRKQTKADWLKQNSGICAFCKKGKWGKQEVCIFEHDHKCSFCQGKGCKECFRGVVHRACNMSIAIIENSPNMIFEDIKKYFPR